MYSSYDSPWASVDRVQSMQTKAGAHVHAVGHQTSVELARPTTPTVGEFWIHRRSIDLSIHLPSILLDRIVSLGEWTHWSRSLTLSSASVIPKDWSLSSDCPLVLLQGGQC